MKSKSAKAPKDKGNSEAGESAAAAPKQKIKKTHTKTAKKPVADASEAGEAAPVKVRGGQ